MDFAGRERGAVTIGFDEAGPKIGTVSLMVRTTGEFRPRADLAQLFASGPMGLIDGDFLKGKLVAVARAMNAGDLGLAGILTSHLAYPRLSKKDLTTIEGVDRLLKAATDDPVHPGYPAKEPDGKGGQFRPKDAGVGSDNGPIRVEDAAATSKEARLERLGRRRGLRSALSRILTFKRIARLVGENVLAGVTEAIPLVDAATDAMALADDMKIVSEAAADGLDTTVAIDFVEKGPMALEDLRVSSEERSFSSFRGFKKVDDLEKIYGSAGEGMEYHHIVEQSAVGDTISEEDVQATGNIVKIPRLLHEEINSYYSTQALIEGKEWTSREFLNGKSFEERYQYGLFVLKKVGVLH